MENADSNINWTWQNFCGKLLALCYVFVCGLFPLWDTLFSCLQWATFPWLYVVEFVYLIRKATGSMGKDLLFRVYV